MTYFYAYSGHVYFAHLASANIVKIGFTALRWPEVRVSQLSYQGGDYGKFKAIGFIEASGRLEKDLHDRFAASRLPRSIGPELFRYSEIADEIGAVLSAAWGMRPELRANGVKPYWIKEAA